ncbi:hypothetical protein ACF0H5_019149 [Mactra antiquata]
MLQLRTIFIYSAIVMMVNGHGRLVQPPSRSTMWRFGFDNPRNYNDNQLFCGGFSVQYGENGGKCGICGDNYKDTVRENEAPDGKYANGVIVAKYDVGEKIDIKVRLTANHKGWFEYRLCQNDDPKKRLTQECFDKHLLTDDNKYRFVITKSMEHVTHSVALPAGVKCRNCVLQWKYNTGNSWGTDPITSLGCIGCGKQEQFYACADISIGYNDIKVGEKNQEVFVPVGDVDERTEINKTVNYEPDGSCAPCNCKLDQPNISSVSIPKISYFLTVALSAFLIF